MPTFANGAKPEAEWRPKFKGAKSKLMRQQTLKKPVGSSGPISKLFIGIATTIRQYSNLRMTARMRRSAHMTTGMKSEIQSTI